MIEALFVGGPLHGTVEALQRPFPTFTVHGYNGKKRKNEAYLYRLDTKNFEPYVYVLAGLTESMRDFMHKGAMQLIETGIAVRPA